MLIAGRELNTIEEALAALTPEQQAHSKRVAAYAEAIFAKLTAMDIYVSVPRGARELVAEHKGLARQAGLYHDLGKLLPDEDPAAAPAEEGHVPIEHTQNGAALCQQLYPDWMRLKAAERKLILDGIMDHHERGDGSGTPLGRRLEDISYMGRVVALADELDNRSIALHSEDPVGDVITAMKAETAAGKFDPEFYRAMSSARARLRKIFDSHRSEAAAVPVTDTWIRRRAGRPMELRYRVAHELDSERTGWLARMTFRDTKDKYLEYDQVKHIVSSNRMGVKMGDYFLYELCDAMRRFEQCGVPVAWAAITLPGTWFGQKDLARHILDILADEKIPRERVILMQPPEAEKKPVRGAAANWQACQDEKIRWVTEREYLAFAITADDAPTLQEDEIVDKALAAGTESEVAG